MEDRDKSIDKSIDERVHQQLVYKDNRIIDLNNVILDKERQILDLQERVREHNEVASVKNQAMRIVQQKFEEMHRDKKDMSTETDPGMLAFSGQNSGPSTSGGSGRNERRARSSSPGHVIAARKTVGTSGTFSPPPIDPPVESSSSKLGPNLPDIDGISRKHHQRKRVTFDLNPGAYRHPHTDSLESALTEASSENALLRQQVVDLNAAVEKMKSDYEAEIVKYTKEAKTAGLKAKVATTARIRELETSLESSNRKYEDETGRLREEVETLRSSRNWEIEQNGQLREQVAHLKEKAHKLTEELDVSEKAKRGLDTEVEESKKLMDLMVDDLLQAENTIVYLRNQKEAIFQDVDRLKEAIVAQDRFIEILEADIVIYEQHIGLLRENLGASKIDHRALIKSKAFETKLLALEREKEQIDKKSTEDRLKTKALDKKCRVLVEQNEQLMARLCELEMSNNGADESRDRRLAEQDERIRQVSLALESERDVSQRLREAKEGLERELMTRTRQEEASNNRHAMDVEMSRMEAENKIDEMTVEVEAARRKVAEVLAEVEQLRATNFDLQMHIETAKRTMEELANSNEELEDRVREVEESFDEKEEDLKQSTWDVEQLTRQNEALRVELDGIRQGFQDTRELSEEVNQLKTELSRQQELHRAQFEAACEQLDQEEDRSRKTSLEVQQEQYILAFEDKIKELCNELEHTKAQKEHFQRLLDQSEQEIVKLKDNAVPVQRKTTALLEAPNLEEIQKQEVQMVQGAPAPFMAPESSVSSEALNRDLERLKLENQDLFEKLQRVEMEANLSGELNVELGRAMLELEEQNDLLKREQAAVAADEVASGRELELHVMMVNEMTEQIAAMQGRIDEMEKSKETQMVEVEKLKKEVAMGKDENQKAQEEVKRLLHNLAEFEIARKEDLEKAAADHLVEVRTLSIQLDDLRREIADLEAKLRVQEQPVLQETVILQSSTPIFDSPAPIPVASEALESPVAPESPASRPARPAPGAEPAEGDDELREQNRLYRECHDDVSRNMQKLIELKDELEIAVQALKAEIWSLNGQLKASILDREGLEDKVAELDALVDKEKKRAIALDVELQEQVDLTERAVRRAAEAENESNQRMAECLEKETRREEIEKAYTRLNEYYQQLQEAYNNVYAQLSAAQTASSESTSSTTLLTSSSESSSSTSTSDAQLNSIVDGIMTILLISRDPSVSLSTQQKLEKVADKLKSLLGEYEENQKALEEQRRISEALEQRLQTLEQASGASNEVTTTRERVEQLEGEIEWKEEECEALKRRIRELEKALEAVAERADESEAARLTTRQADVDSLFRTNAELAHTNVRLQNEVDDSDEWKSKMEEEKQQLEQHVKELEEQVADLLHQHEASLQLVQSLQSTSNSTDNSAELQETQKEVQRLSAIEKTLNNRILALEDQNMELEEKVQEIEEELSTVKQNAEKPEIAKPSTSEDAWDDWGETETSEKVVDDGKRDEELEEAKNEVGRLTEVEKALTMRMEMLQMHNEQLETKMKEQEKVQKKPEAEEDDWGWGETQETSKPEAEDNSELLNAKSEVERLSQIEKVLNNRILALEDQNLELEERLQEMEDELADEKNKKKEETKKEDDWGWGEEKEDEGQSAELQKTIAELQEKLKFQKEVIEKAETELSEQQDKYDELEEAYEQAKQSDSAKDLDDQLKTLESQLESAKLERDSALEQLEEKEIEKKQLEQRVKELEEALVAKTEEKKEEQEESAWDDDGWGDEEEKNDPKEEEVLLLQGTISELQEKLKFQKEVIEKAEAELTEQQDRYDELEEAYEQAKESSASVKTLSEQLETAKLERDSLIQQLNQKEAEKMEMETRISELEAQKDEVKVDDGWNDDGWGEEEKVDTEEVLQLRQSHQELTQKIREQENMLRKQFDDADVMAEKIIIVASEHAKVELLLKAANQELEKVKETLALKEKAESEDDSEVDKLQEAQKILEMKVEALQNQLIIVREEKEELASDNAELQDQLKTVKAELEETKRKLSEVESAGWNDDEGWGNEEDETKKELEAELVRKNETVEQLREQIAQLQREVIDASESADMSALENLERVKEELRVVSEQNGLLKDSEARLLDHADEFAVEMEQYREKCSKLTVRIAELEDQLQKVNSDGQQAKRSSDELVTLRQQLANAEQEIRSRNAVVSDREGLITELRRQVAEHTKTIEELTQKLRTLSAARRPTRPKTSSISSTSARMESRPSSQMSTSSRISTATTSSFVPEGNPNPIQSYGSAFDPVMPQVGDPLRRRNK